MNEQNHVADDEISLLDIYDFLKDGWVTIVATTVLGGVIGLSAAFIIPEKFLASASIQPAHVLGEDVESVDVLAEKMRSPTYYSQQTLAACKVSDKINPAQTLATELKPSVGRKSAFVSVSFKSTNTNTSVACLKAVLGDVIAAESILAKPILDEAMNDLNQARLKLETAKIRQTQALSQNKERLQISKEKLRAAQDFIQKFEVNAGRFDFRDDQFSASSLLLATMLSKQNEIRDLQVQINDLEMKVSSAITDRDDEVFKLEREINDIGGDMLPPTTGPAEFSTGIYSPSEKVEPKRSLIVVISIFVGGFIGFLILVSRRAVKYIKERPQVKSTQTQA